MGFNETERVAQGVELLDTEVPGWAERIDLAELDFQNPARCILGLLFGDFMTGIASLDLFDGTWSGFKSQAHGFDWEPGYRNEEAPVLEDEWRRVIMERKALVRAASTTV